MITIPTAAVARRLGLLTAVALAALALAACKRPAGGPPPGLGGRPGMGGPGMPPPEVVTLTVTPKPLMLTTELPGRTAPFRIAEIRPQVNGLIQQRLFTEGAEVTAGQVLYQIDPAPFQAALDNAQAALARAEANLPAIRGRAARYHEALADHAVSQQDVEDADAALKQAEAEVQYGQAMVASARINRNYAEVRAPIAGRIGKSSVTDGAIVTAYQPQPLATIQQLDPIYVDVPQATAEVLRLRHRPEAGGAADAAALNQVRLVLEEGTAYPLEGTLQFRDISVDPTTGSVIFRMVFPNPKGELLPGMFVRAIVKEGEQAQAILVPQQAVSRDPKGNPVALVVGAGGKVEPRLLVVPRAIGDQWLVAAGLAAGDRVIVEGLQKARPGAVVQEAAPAGTAPAPAAPGVEPKRATPPAAPARN